MVSLAETGVLLNNHQVSGIDVSMGMDRSQMDLEYGISERLKAMEETVSKRLGGCQGGLQGKRRKHRKTGGKTFLIMLWQHGSL